MTDRYAVIGNPISHSRSPRIHALFAEQTAQDLSYTSMLAPLDGFARAIADFAAAGGRGANVTVPFKAEAFCLAHEVSPRARAAAAANTLTFQSGRIVADNTDGIGLMRDLSVNLGFAVRGRRVLLLGAGGAARGVMLPLLTEEPAQLVVANRSADKAHDLVAEFAREQNDAVTVKPIGCGLSGLNGRAFDIVINATSAGLTDIPIELSPDVFAPGSFAYDMIYGRDTCFLQQARNAGARTADGLGMLVEQAAEAFFLWRGVRPDSAAALAQLRREVSGK